MVCSPHIHTMVDRAIQKVQNVQIVELGKHVPKLRLECFKGESQLTVFYNKMNTFRYKTVIAHFARIMVI